MDLAQTFQRAAARRIDCAEPVFACAPDYLPYWQALLGANSELRSAMAERGDVLGAAASVAKAAGAEPLSIALGRPAWGVALVADKHTLCLWDGRTVWAQGRNGATRLKPAHIVAAWSLSVCPPS